MPTYPIAVGTTNSHAPKNRNAGPASRFIDSTVPNLVKRPVAYSNMINGTDHNHKKPNQTIRNTNAPVGKKKHQSRIHSNENTKTQHLLLNGDFYIFNIPQGLIMYSSPYYSYVHSSHIKL